MADALGLIRHSDQPFFSGRAQPDGKGLDNGHQRHIGIGRHGDGANILAAQGQADQNGGRAKINHGSNADKQQQGHGLGGVNAHLKQPIDNALNLARAGHGLVDHPRHGDIDQNSAEAHGQQQSGLHLFFHRQPDQQSAYGVHHQLFPGKGQQPLGQKFHNSSFSIFFRRRSDRPERASAQKFTTTRGLVSKGLGKNRVKSQDRLLFQPIGPQ